MSDVTVTTTTPHVTVICSSVLTLATTVAVHRISVGLAVASGQHDVVLPPPLILRDTMRGVIGISIVLQ